MRKPCITIGVLSLFLFSVATGSTITYTYDPAGRLTAATYNSDTSINYTYDANGNLVRKSMINGGPDSDGDGIPDAWMNQYFGHPTGMASDLSRAGDDADGTGMTNLQKYLAGLDPKNPNSFFRITSVAKSGGLQITWSSVPGKTYCVYVSDDLFIFTPMSGFILAGTGETSKSFTDTTTSGVLHRFYKVVLVP